MTDRVVSDLASLDKAFPVALPADEIFAGKG